MKVAIIGSDSFLGKHVLKYANTRKQTDVEVFPYVSDVNICQKVADIAKNADIIINLHEFHDLSLLPDKRSLELHNVEFVRSLLFHMNQRNRVQGLVHLSSCYVQCSNFWPNVYELEAPADKYQKQWPFPDYCRSKAEAESLVTNSDVDSFIIRPVALYGPDDDCSFLTDLIASYDFMGCVPCIGDQGGVVQVAYVENVAAKIWKLVDHLAKQLPSTENSLEDSFGDSQLTTIERKPFHEVMLLADNTKLSDVYTNFGGIITNGKREMSSTYMPFLPFYYLYIIFAFIVTFLSKWIEMPERIKRLPYPFYFYHNLHHWSMFNTTKIIHILGKDENEFTFEEALSQSRPYYRCLSHLSVPKYSWQPRIRPN